MAAFAHGGFDAFRFTAAQLAGAAPLTPAALSLIEQKFYEKGLVLLADVFPHEALDALKPQLHTQSVAVGDPRGSLSFLFFF
jgi:hypothetical protein